MGGISTEEWMKDVTNNGWRARGCFLLFIDEPNPHRELSLWEMLYYHFAAAASEDTVGRYIQEEQILCACSPCAPLVEPDSYPESF